MLDCPKENAFLEKKDFMEKIAITRSNSWNLNEKNAIFPENFSKQRVQLEHNIGKFKSRFDPHILKTVREAETII